MNFMVILKQSCFSPHLKSNTKQGIIEEMIDLMVDAGKIRDKQDALKTVLKREKRTSTGLQHGVAVPHGKTDKVDGLISAFALKKEGIDFDSVDGELSKIFIMTISPTLQVGSHIEYLMKMGKRLSIPFVRKKILKAKTKAEIIEILSSKHR